MTNQHQWTIENFRNLKTNTRRCSGVFTIKNCNWKLAVYRGKEDKKYLAVYLYVADASKLIPGWSIYAEFTLTVVNQSSRENSKTVMKHTFCGKEVRCGRSSFMRLEELERKNSGFIRDKKCIVKVEFRVVEPAGVVYFKDLAGIEKSFGQLLQKVLSWYPSLLEQELKTLKKEGEELKKEEEELKKKLRLNEKSVQKTREDLKKAKRFK